MVIFYKKWKKYNETQLTKNKMDIKYSKNDKSSTLPRFGKVKIVTLVLAVLLSNTRKLKNQ